MKHVIVTVFDMTRRVIEVIGTVLEESLEVLDQKGRVLDEEGRMPGEDVTVLERRGTRPRDDGPLLESGGRTIEITVPMSDCRGALTRRSRRFRRRNAGYRLAAPGLSTVPRIHFPRTTL